MLPADLLLQVSRVVDGLIAEKASKTKNLTPTPSHTSSPRSVPWLHELGDAHLRSNPRRPRTIDLAERGTAGIIADQRLGRHR